MTFHNKKVHTVTLNARMIFTFLSVEPIRSRKISVSFQGPPYHNSLGSEMKDSI